LTTTFCPCLPNSSAMAAPKPRDAPVTRHTLALSATIESWVGDDGVERSAARRVEVVMTLSGVVGANAEEGDDANATAPTTRAVAAIIFIMVRSSTGKVEVVECKYYATHNWGNSDVDGDVVVFARASSGGVSPQKHVLITHFCGNYSRLFLRIDRVVVVER
jgi:hypothetical protein